MSHGEFRGYDELQPIMRRVADMRGLSRDQLDEISGLPRGYSAKVLAEVPLRKLGPDTFGPLASAIGLKFIAIDDDVALAKFTARGEKRVEKYALNAGKNNGVVHFKISLRKLRQMGRKGGRNSRKHMSWKTKRGLGRKAANARWDKVRAVQAKRSAAATLKAEPQGAET